MLVVIDDLLYYTLAGLTTICRIIFVKGVSLQVSSFKHLYFSPAGR